MHAAAPPTDVIANELAIRLFLFGLAAMSFYEALKLERPRSYVAWAAVALFFTSGVALTPISNAWPAGVGWLSDLVSNPVTWFVLAMGAYLAVRPMWTKTPQPAASDAGPGTSNVASFEIQVTKRIDAFEATIRQTVNNQTNYMNVIDAKIERQGERADEHLKRIDATSGDLASLKSDWAEISALAEKVELVRVDGAIATRDLDKLKDELDTKYRNLRLSLYSIYLREHLAKVAENIENLANQLYERLKSGEVYNATEWEEWEATHQLWHSALVDWLQNARFYAHEVEEYVFKIDEQEYEPARWTVEDRQVPNSEAMRRFKKHRIVHAQWQIARTTVDTGIAQVAYQGMTDKDVQQRRIPR